MRISDWSSDVCSSDLKIGTIRDLIAYRRRNDHLVQKRSEVQFTSRWGGDWTAMAFFNKATGTEQIALQKGRISLDTPTLVRMHQRSEEHTSELQSLMRISSAVFCSKKKRLNQHKKNKI